MSEFINQTDDTQDVEACNKEVLQKSDRSSDANNIYMKIAEVSTSKIKISNDNTKIVLTVYGNDMRSKHPTKMGGVYSFLFIYGNPLLIIGPQFYMSIILSAIITIFNFLLVNFAYVELPRVIKYIGLLIFILQIISQLHCTFANPGIPHKNNYVSETIMHTIYQNVKHNNYKFDKYRVCKKCNILVSIDQDITHCEDCNICVENLDHHCVWIGKCIAKKNIWSFNLFIISTILFGLFAVGALIWLAIMKVVHNIFNK